MNLLQKILERLGRPAFRLFVPGVLACWIAVGMTALSADTPKAEATNSLATNSAPSAGSSDLLRVGDRLTVLLSDVPNPIPPVDQTISEDGYITLHLNQKFKAAGRTKTELQQDIFDRYVPKFYVRMTPTVKSEERFFFVTGEVRAPNRYIYSGELTVMKAITAAGGFTDFAKESEVKLTRMDKKLEIVNCLKAKKDAKYDRSVYPGDTILVERRIGFFK